MAAQRHYLAELLQVDVSAGHDRYNFSPACLQRCCNCAGSCTFGDNSVSLGNKVESERDLI
jgi:hypothetical protein